MESYEPYSYILKRLPDFRVKYQFIPLNSDLSFFVYQGPRYDFRYKNDGNLKHSDYMIWPEFEDDGSFTILDKWMPIKASGTAKMWIINQKMTDYHRRYIKIGTVGYMISGTREIAECEVIELMTL